MKNDVAIFVYPISASTFNLQQVVLRCRYSKAYGYKVMNESL